MSLKIGTVTIDVLPAVVPFLAGDLQSSACVDEELKHFLRHEGRPAVDARLREFVSSQPWWNDAVVYAGPARELESAGGVTRIRHARKQQPLSDMPYGSSRQWNYRSFRMITSRHLAATWEDTRLATKAA